jgi:DNA-binding NtrC family response regulator
MVAALQTMKHTPVISSNEEFAVFIVDDNQSYLSALGYRMMKENPLHHYKVHCFNTGEDCMHHLHLRPKLIIMDYNLACAEKDSLCGAELIRKIRRTRPETPIVLLSGQKKLDHALETADEESYYYLVRDHATYESVKKILAMIRKDHPIH